MSKKKSFSLKLKSLPDYQKHIKNKVNLFSNQAKSLEMDFQLSTLNWQTLLNRKLLTFHLLKTQLMEMNGKNFNRMS